jgi:hypothetical protein
MTLWTTLNLLFSHFESPTIINKHSRSDDWLLCLKYKNLYNHSFGIYLPDKRFSIAVVRTVYLFSYKLITTQRLVMCVRIGTENCWKTFITQTLCLAFGWVLCNVKQDAETRKVWFAIATVRWQMYEMCFVWKQSSGKFGICWIRRGNFKAFKLIVQYLVIFNFRSEAWSWTPTLIQRWSTQCVGLYFHSLQRITFTCCVADTSVSHRLLL